MLIWLVAGCADCIYEGDTLLVGDAGLRQVASGFDVVAVDIEGDTYGSADLIGEGALRDVRVRDDEVFTLQADGIGELGSGSWQEAPENLRGAAVLATQAQLRWIVQEQPLKLHFYDAEEWTSEQLQLPLRDEVITAFNQVRALDAREGRLLLIGDTDSNRTMVWIYESGGWDSVGAASEADHNSEAWSLTWGGDGQWWYRMTDSTGEWVVQVDGCIAEVSSGAMGLAPSEDGVTGWGFTDDGSPTRWDVGSDCIVEESPVDERPSGTLVDVRGDGYGDAAWAVAMWTFEDRNAHSQASRICAE
ncbi:MAG TPA: hypothetical protein QGF58_13285 [Myxococcota bacterium]|nr:hypothetical protein [Myxococcota bacterium]